MDLGRIANYLNVKASILYNKTKWKSVGSIQCKDNMIVIFFIFGLLTRNYP